MIYHAKLEHKLKFMDYDSRAQPCTIALHQLLHNVFVLYMAWHQLSYPRTQPSILPRLENLEFRNVHYFNTEFSSLRKRLNSPKYTRWPKSQLMLAVFNNNNSF